MATQEQVNQIADTLAADGKRITVALVREALGGGSYSTLSPLVKTWREAQASEAAAVDALPEEAEAAGAQATRTIWATAMAHAQMRIDLAQQHAAQRVSEAEAEKTEAVAEIERLETDSEARRNALAALEARCDALTQHSAECKATVESLREQLASEHQGVCSRNGNYRTLSLVDHP